MKNTNFNSEFFFTIILPPIIFSAGYNLKSRRFFKYIIYIVSFGCVSTILNFLFVTVFTYFANQYGLFSISNAAEGVESSILFSINDILLFAAVISATDTIAALTFIKEESNPKLCSILFGEGVVNDAIAIVLYRIILSFNKTKQGHFLKRIRFLVNPRNRQELRHFNYHFLHPGLRNWSCVFLLVEEVLESSHELSKRGFSHY